jgi:outer membrane protein assembly factor BamB
MDQGSRRQVLRSVASGVVVGLAGCSSSGDDDPTADGQGDDDERSTTDPGTEPASEQTDTATETPTPAAPDSWPMFQFDQANTGTQDTAPVTEGRETWRFEADDPIVYSPVVADGTVFVGTRDGTVYAVDTESGTQEWSGDLGTFVRGSPAVVGGTVFVVAVTTATESSSLYALDAASGTERWAFEGPTYAPTIAGGTVYVFGYGSAESDPQTLYALDAADGTERWTAELPGRTSQENAPAVVDGTVFAPGDNLHALDADDGTELWTVEPAEEAFRVPTVADGTVYVGDRTAMYALNATNGSEQWWVDADPNSASAAVADGSVYLCDANYLVSLSADDGSERWRTKLGATQVASAPAVVGDTVYVTEKFATVRAYDVADGSERWRFEAAPRMWGSPAVVDGRLYATCTNGKLYAIE